MTTLQYKIIKNQKQYNDYCDMLEEMVSKYETKKDDIEMLTLLIEKWDEEHNSFMQIDPVEIIKSLMDEHQLNQTELGAILGLSKGTVSKILNYRKGLSKETIRALSNHFKISQEAFNKPYKLVNSITVSNPKKRKRASGKMNA